ncbi:LOW QUALITY PROTEIN: clusterin-like protein 1 [Trichomycterus rosablanca]|uniref:LOW QUALITY PROTEIN: clusterin-like protein 1 n=1 Tax=Trichomycterus rosablanca TaxID=2290929 RepID=UPI002F35BE61
MRTLLLPLALLAFLKLMHTAPGPAMPTVSTETLKRLSLEGEKMVDKELRRTLYGVKQIKAVMAKNEVKHEQLMKSLQNSREKKKEVVEIAQNVEEKLNEAEQQCKETLKSSWDECRPCLENTCKNFYTKNCRRGFATFSTKLESFFQKMSAHFGTHEELAANESTEMSELELLRIEDSFSNLVSKVSILVNHSTALVSRFHSELDDTLRQAFAPTPQEDKESKALNSAFLQEVGLEEVLDSFIDFTKSVVQEFGAVIMQVFDDLHGVTEKAEQKQEKQLFLGHLQSGKLCRDLRRQSVECWQLQNKCQACQGSVFSECLSMQELHIELDQVSELLEVAKEQYEEVLGIVERHTEDTISWIGNMVNEFGWVVELADDKSISENVFNITTIMTEEKDTTLEEEINSQAADTKVEVNILNAPTLKLTVPGSLQPLDPAFIQYVATEALDFYKHRNRLEDA